MLVMYVLGAAMIVAGLSMLWYLFQTLRIMWGYSSLLTIAAVIFSPLIHIVFYFIPKDGFDKYERGVFKRYFLSIGVIAALGIVASIVIPAIEPQYQSDTMTSDADSSQPWDWDIRAEDQEIAPTQSEVDSTDITNAEELHYDAIFQAHPDANIVMESPEFKAWLQGQSDDTTRMLREGTATEVIYVFSNFKQDLKNYRAYEYQTKRDNAQAVAQTEYQKKQSRDLEAIKSNTQNYYDNQNREQIEEYTAVNRETGSPAIKEALITSKPSYSAPVPIVSSAPSQIVNCDGAGCWGTDGTRYNKGAGDTYFPSTGGVCQNVGGQMQCN